MRILNDIPKCVHIFFLCTYMHVCSLHMSGVECIRPGSSLRARRRCRGGQGIFIGESVDEYGCVNEYGCECIFASGTMFE